MIYFVTFSLLNEIVFNDVLLTLTRNYETSAKQVEAILYKWQIVYLVSFFFLMLGYFIGIKFKIFRVKKILISPTLIGVVFILLGLLGSILLMGSIENYFSALGNIASITDDYTNRVESFGNNLVISLILRSFFLPGLLLLFYSNINSKKSVFFRFSLLLSIAIIFNGVTGQRSDYLAFPLYIMLLSIYRNGLNLKYAFAAIFFIFSSIMLGMKRDYANLDIQIILDNYGKATTHFISNYIINYSGVHSLLMYEKELGFFAVKTIFNQFLGIFGGPTPITTQETLWLFLTGSKEGSNPRLGLPIEFYINYGYSGLLLMIAIGFLLAFFVKKVKSIDIHSPFSLTLVAWSIYMIISIIQSSWNYIPRQIFYLSWPYFIISLFINKKRINA